jgi:hypothetical protein
MVTSLKLFGKGQVTLPKTWRDQYDTDIFLAEEVPQGLLIRPVVESAYYEMGDQYFGINFPVGRSASTVLADLKKANARLS